MSDNPKPRARVRAGSSPYTADAAPAAGKAFVTDSFQNFIAQLGYGTNNLSSGATYGFNPITRNRTQLEWMYRGSWMVGRVVDATADDMTRAGITITSDMRPDVMDEFTAYLRHMLVWQRLNESIKWGRLYGGALGFIMIDGQDPTKELRPETVGKDQFRGIMPLDRWMVWPHLEDLVSDPGGDFGSPRFYEVVADARTLPRWKIHHSRCIRFEGVRLPYWQRMTENTWGISVIERLFDRLLAFDSTTQGAAQLVYRAHLRTYFVEGLRELIAAGGPAYQAFLQQVQLIRLMQSNESLTVLDSTDKFETYQYAFSGLSDVLVQFSQQLAGAAETPLTRLFGQSPAGMNATGESDMRNYYDAIRNKQETDLRRPIGVVLDIAHRSKFGTPLPNGTSFEFVPLWQMTESEKVAYASTVTTAVATAVQDMGVSPQTALKELRQSARVTGIWSNITDEDIEQAAEQQPPGAEGLLAGMQPGGDPQEQPGAEQDGEDTLFGTAHVGMPGTGRKSEDKPTTAKPVSPLAGFIAAHSGDAEPDDLGEAEGEEGDGADTRREELRVLAEERPDTQSPSWVEAEGDKPDSSRFSLDRDHLPMTEYHGINLVIETHRGDTRTGYGWSTTMPADYGYISGTSSSEGAQEQMDVFLGESRDSEQVWIIEQGDPRTGEFDEHKVMLGYLSRADAINDYVAAFSDGLGAERVRQIIHMGIDDFRNWLDNWRYGKAPGQAHNRENLTDGH